MAGVFFTLAARANIPLTTVEVTFRPPSNCMKGRGERSWKKREDGKRKKLGKGTNWGGKERKSERKKLGGEGGEGEEELGRKGRGRERKGRRKRSERR